MAFFADSDLFVRDAWPCAIGRPMVETEGLMGVPSWRVLPTTYDALCERVGVVGPGTRQPRVILNQTGLERQHQLVQLTVRLQGFVSDVSLGATGNWQGSTEHAPKATQYLTLCAGKDMGSVNPAVMAECRDAFRAQRRGVLHIEAIVSNALGFVPGHELGRGGKINLRRRVFTKASPVRPGGTLPGISLARHEDPSGKAHLIEKDWIIDHRVKTAVQANSGKFALTNPLVIRRGDFVDVAALFTVVVHHGRYGKTTEVVLAPLEVVRLRTAQEARALLRGPAMEQWPDGRQGEGVLEVVSGLDIEDCAAMAVPDDDMLIVD